MVLNKFLTRGGLVLASLSLSMTLSLAACGVVHITRTVHCQAVVDGARVGIYHNGVDRGQGNQWCEDWKSDLLSQGAHEVVMFQVEEY